MARSTDLDPMSNTFTQPSSHPATSSFPSLRYVPLRARSLNLVMERTILLVLALNRETLLMQNVSGRVGARGGGRRREGGRRGRGGAEAGHQQGCRRRTAVRGVV
jgi:hypothetical protein